MELSFESFDMQKLIDKLGVYKTLRITNKLF